MTVLAALKSERGGGDCCVIDSEKASDSPSSSPWWFRLTLFLFAALQVVLWWHGMFADGAGRRAVVHSIGSGQNSSQEIAAAPWIPVTDDAASSERAAHRVELPEDLPPAFSPSASPPAAAGEEVLQNLCNVSWTEVELDYHRVVAALRGASLLMIGDSVMRYQYINLAYYITSGGAWRWEGEGPENEKEYQHGSWENFFVVTNQRILHEVCDCRRTEKHARRLQWDRVREGRYYNNTRNGVAFAFLLQLGDAGLILNRPKYLNGTCHPETGCTQHCPVGVCIQYTSEWHYPKVSMEDLWIQQICVRQPTVVLLNMGRWTSLDHAAGVRRIAKTHLALTRCLRNPRKTTIFWWATLPQKSEARTFLSSAKNGGRTAAAAAVPRRDHRYIAPWIKASQMRSGASVEGPQWQFVDQFPLLWDILRDTRHEANSTRRWIADPYWDDRHFVTPIVAALNRNLLLRMFGCSLRKEANQAASQR